MDKICKIKGPELVTRLFELQSRFTNIHFLVWPLESGNWKEKEKNKTLNISKTKRAFQRK